MPTLEHLPQFQLSQSHLNLLTTCPRKFQYYYLDQLGLPQVIEQQERQELGSRFHQLMQQQELGLPVAALIQAEAHLQRWFEKYTQTPPVILAGLRQSEYRLTYSFQGYLLVAIYDLLIQGNEQAQIVDWKTYTRPQNPQSLQQNWQTRLYPFILAEASDYTPEQIRFTYWFAESKGQQHAEPASLTFAYSTAQHEHNRQELAHLLSQLTQWLEAYQQGIALPQVSLAAGQCHAKNSSCHFEGRCDRSRDEAKLLSLDLDAIQEVSL